MTSKVVLDTTIDEPPADAGEVEMLLFALDRARAQFAWKCGGLDADGLRKRHPPTTMTLGGLLKHLAWDEDRIVAEDLTGTPIGPPWAGQKVDREWEWRTAADDSPQYLYALWKGAVERSRKAWGEALSAGGLDQPSKRDFPGFGRPNLRRILVDLCEEYVRHTGHADLLREAVDGLVGEDPPQP